MPNEELVQRGCIDEHGRLRGKRFGDFEELDLGNTKVRELKSVGVDFVIPSSISFSFKSNYKVPKKPENAMPDRVFLRRVGGSLRPVAIAETKRVTMHTTAAHQLRAAEQAVFAGAALGVEIAVTWDGARSIYISVPKSLATNTIVHLPEQRDFSPSVLTNLLAGDVNVEKDPASLAETVWQMIWHATKEEPKQCLLTFVEIFMLKFLSDNLQTKDLPSNYRFDMLLSDPKDFFDAHGMTAIEYYVNNIRKHIKSIFPETTIVTNGEIADVFGLSLIVSKASVINGFAFLRSSSMSLAAFNRIFLDILGEFQRFGPLTAIDPEFKLRLYETFLRQSARQQRLGQFFTPRNVVRPMVKMARLDKLRDGAVVLDPAAGVGGFVLEPQLLVPALSNNVTFVGGQPIRRVKFIGADVDTNTHILAKANTLIHFVEKVRDPSVTMSALNALMAETFVLMNQNETLGSLQNPPEGKVDVILTNPPYVTKGSGVYKDEVKEAGISPNGVDLRQYYDRSGLGVEALFIRYIAGALKPGGRAFVVVPLGMLNRTDPNPKRRILDDCNLLASIALPRNTFFNTAQLTYILAIEKRHTRVDPRPAVFCGIARTIGESLDWERVPTPDDNDLDDLARMFVAFTEGDPTAVGNASIAKVVDADKFTENDRWDVTRFWTETELVDLGQKESAVARTDFIDETTSELEEIVGELAATKLVLTALTTGATVSLRLGDDEYFHVRSGSRVTGKEIREHPGDLPIYSCFKTDREIKGKVDEDFFRYTKEGHVEMAPIVTVNANGASVGRVYVRRERCGITDDVIIVDVVDDTITHDYLAVALQAAVDKGGFLYEAKLFTARVKDLQVDIPVGAGGAFDVEQQNAIASAVRRFDALRTRLHDLGVRTKSVRAV